MAHRLWTLSLCLQGRQQSADKSMFSIRKCSVPANTLLSIYSIEGAYVDCYSTEVPAPVTFSEFIFAFYTTPLFKVERGILKRLASRPSTDIQAKQLADRTTDHFAAWSVERRTENELLMCDFHGRTRSWLMVNPMHTAGDPRTQLYFGSAVVPRRNPKNGELSLGWNYQALLGFHKIYSVLLLYSARRSIRHHLPNS